MKLSDFKVLTFDVYGTLIDWESGMVAGLKPLTDRVSRSLTRDDILEAHAYYESTTQRWTPAMPLALSLAPGESSVKLLASLTRESISPLIIT